MSNLVNPKCPKCTKQLDKIISPRVLTSHPPYKCFSCQCGFSGYVMMEFSEESKKLRQECKGFKFGKNIVVTNDEKFI